jgi:hypothetical protein
MKRDLILVLVQIVIQWFSAECSFGQGITYEGPDDPAGDIAAIRSGYMNGNSVSLYFKNNTQLSDWPAPDAHIWPVGNEGVRMTDGIGLMIGARVFIANDSIPVTDWNEIMSRSDLDTLYYLQTSYREGMDMNPSRTVEWGLYPVFGYFNKNHETPAMSNDPNSWPQEGWPFTGNELKWPGDWNSRFGRGMLIADLETYIVVNDAQDQEYLGPEDPVKYYPRPGVRIGDKRSDVTIQKGMPWGGIGIRVEQRSFQWSNPFTNDIIFLEYTVANISDYDLPEIFFGYWVDNAIGGDPADDVGFYDRMLDLAYSWDIDGLGTGGKPTGTVALAYLETPGKSFDGIDNDDDGLIDEQRDNMAALKIGPLDGISDLNKFLKFYNLQASDLKEHWDADEDQDWDDGIDTNQNGIYDMGEYAGDDVGLDGVGPDDFIYTGPDADGTECNHKPDMVAGLGCEPDFGAMDISESDMLGLTSVHLFPVPEHTADDLWFEKDQSMWNLLGNNQLTEYSGMPSNLIMTFASGNFPLYRGREEHISCALLHAYDSLDELNASDHEALSLFGKKQGAQTIYDNNYRFGLGPPVSPTLTAAIVDNQVLLSWDDISETNTREPILNNVNDFEGYKLYRATDPAFQEGVEWIADGYGNPLFRKPIFQCDLIDGIQGFADYGLIRGVAYFLGSETGIVHQFIDTTVQPDQTYYYALVAYDYGSRTLNMAPAECGMLIIFNENHEILRRSRNIAIVDLSGVGIQENEPLLYSYSLSQNFPNPFNSTTQIKYSLSQSNHVVMKLYNLAGQEIETLVNDFQQAGRHSINLTSNGRPSGIYIYKVKSGDFSATRKLIIQK